MCVLADRVEGRTAREEVVHDEPQAVDVHLSGVKYVSTHYMPQRAYYFCLHGHLRVRYAA